jgi:hypothetical protein
MNLVEAYSIIPASKITVGMYLVTGKFIENQRNEGFEPGTIVKVINIDSCGRSCFDNKCTGKPIVVQDMNSKEVMYSCYLFLYTTDGKLVVPDKK